MKSKVFIDPSNRMKYSTFYIKGLEKVFGKENILFSSKYFKELNRRADSHSFDHYMAFVYSSETEVQKIIIDYRDKTNIKENALAWCDKYAKINFNRELTNTTSTKKIISIPPGFGIRIWGFWKTIFLSFIHLTKCNFLPLESIRTHFTDYLSLYFRRTFIESYQNENSSVKSQEINDSKKQNIFFIATLWQVKNCIATTNILRKKFIEYCKHNDKIEFEGGFYANTSHPQYEEFKDIIFLNRYSINEYLNKTKDSSFVFNTPAVLNCHGWKLAEFMALGKAIISTAISNQLPEKLTHGKNIHFISDDNELVDAINELISNHNYREQLEIGAKNYYEKYVSPERVITYILDSKCN